MIEGELVMGNTRRVVTGVNAAGKSTVVSDDTLPDHSDGNVAITVFSTEASATLPLRELSTKAVYPREQPPYATVWRVIQFPPQGSPDAHDVPLHTTPTIDYLMVRSGELTMLLDDGVEVVLKAGDYLVQGGVAHGWLNRGSEPCIADCIMVGLPSEQS